MGFLTTITIYNDAADQILKNKKELAEAIDKACSGIQLSKGRDYNCLGNHANAIILQKPRHASDNTLFMHAGNTVIDVYNAESEWAIDQFIHEMEYHLKRLKKIKNERKNNNT